jgi:DNA polymerase bacteriophage-type
VEEWLLVGVQLNTCLGFIMHKLYIDLETYSEINLRTHGTHVYAAESEILLIAYAIDDTPAKVIIGGQFNDELLQAWNDPDYRVIAHNSHFDRIILAAHGYALPIERWYDTMVKAYAHSLPGQLGQLSEVFRLPTDKAKDKDGRRLILLFCKPRPKSSKLRRADKVTHPEEWQRFVEYARLDVEAMREIDKLIPKWNYQGGELALWHLDQRINDRGVGIDTELVRSAIEAIDRAQKRLARKTAKATNGDIDSASRRDALLNYIMQFYGIGLPDMQKATLERRLSDPDLPESVKELLRLRLETATTSTAKYNTLSRATSDDGRLRGTLQFDGATRTGRWAGRMFQPQNLPRPVLRQEDIDMGIAALKVGGAELVYDNIMELTSSAIRGCIVAPAGSKLVVADLSNIEGRVLAWLAGEEWKLKAFRDYDTGTGYDLYKLAYAKAFNMRPEDVDKAQRQIGKVMELGLGYEGGVGAFLTFAANYGIDLDAMAEQAVIPDAIWQEAQRAWDWFNEQKRPTLGLSNTVWCVCDSFKRTWRQAHKMVSSFWKELEYAAVEVISTGKTLQCRKLTLDRQGAWLRIQLPSGRFVCYPAALVDDEGKLSYMGVDQYTKKWTRIKTYGGKLVENITQAVARDILADSMPKIEAAGYRIILTVHDEIISEAPDSGAFSHEALAGLMASNPMWAKGLPLAAAGFEDYRYRKD